MRVPYPDDPRVSADEERATRLLPVHNDAAPVPNRDHLVQPPEGADHLNARIASRRIVVAIQTNHAVRWKASVECIHRRKNGIGDLPVPTRMMPPTSWLMILTAVMPACFGLPLKKVLRHCRCDQSQTLYETREKLSCRDRKTLNAHCTVSVSFAITR